MKAQTLIGLTAAAMSLGLSACDQRPATRSTSSAGTPAPASTDVEVLSRGLADNPPLLRRVLFSCRAYRPKARDELCLAAAQAVRRRFSARANYRPAAVDLFPAAAPRSMTSPGPLLERKAP